MCDGVQVGIITITTPKRETYVQISFTELQFPHAPLGQDLSPGSITSYPNGLELALNFSEPVFSSVK